jgi:hypothetical protein
MKRTPLLLCLVLLAHMLLAQQKQTYSKTVPATGISKGSITLEVPAGVIELQATGNDFMKTEVQYNKADWKPRMDLNTNNGAATLSLAQKDMDNTENNEATENKWTVNISKNTPTALHLKIGAGETKLDLSNSQVQTLDVEAGAVALDVNLSKSGLRKADIKAGVGEVKLDLSGDWDHDLTVDVIGGIGDISITLPQSTGVKLKVSGLGSLDVAGLTKEGNYYRNAALGKSKHTLTINATGGLGSIKVQTKK